MVVGIIILLLVAAFAYTGYKRGFYQEGRYICGMILGLIASPVISVWVEKLIYTYFSDYFPKGIIFKPLVSYSVRLLAFALTIYFVKYLFWRLTDIRLKGIFRKVDQIGGVIFSIAKALIIIWVIDLVMIKNPFMPTTEFGKLLASSEIYTFICSYNPLYYLIRI